MTLSCSFPTGRERDAYIEGWGYRTFWALASAVFHVVADPIMRSERSRTVHGFCLSLIPSFDYSHGPSVVERNTFRLFSLFSVTSSVSEKSFIIEASSSVCRRFLPNGRNDDGGW